MKAYVITTGTIFGLLTVAHVRRVLQEDPHLAERPWHILITVAAAALCLWACGLVWRASRP